MKEEQSYSNIPGNNKTPGFVNQSEDEKLREAVFKTDFEKFQLFTNMLRRETILNKVKIHSR